MATAPSGEAYASARQLAKLEKLVYDQQSTIERLEQERELWSTSIQTFLQEQFTKAQGMRGSKGQDILTTASFISVHLGEAIQSLQRSNEQFLKTSLPFTKLQELEKRLLSRPASNEEVAALIQRIERLESSPVNQEILSQEQSQQQQPHQQQPQQQSEELETMKAHISHLEETLIKEVQRAYKTVHRPGDLGAPLGKLQAQVERLTQDIQTIKRTDGQQIAETFLTAGVANMKQEFQKGLDNRATVQQWATLQERIDTIEQFSRDVQIQVLRSQAQQTAFENRISEQFSDERWASMERGLSKQIDSKLREGTNLLTQNLYDQKQLIETALQKNDAALGTLEREVKIHYGPDMLKSHVDAVKRQVLQYIEAKHTDHSEQTTRKLTGFLEDLQTSKRTFLELASEVSQKLAAANLTERFRAFEDLVSKHEATLAIFGKRADEIDASLATEAARMDERNTTLEGYREFMNKSIADLEASIRAEQQSARTSLDTWCENRKQILQGTFASNQALLEALSNKVLIAEETLQTTLEKRKEFEEHIEKEYAKKVETLSTTIARRLEQNEEYLISRVSELSGATKKLGETISEQRNKLEILLSEQTLGEFVTEIERRVRGSQEDWSRRRTQLIDSRLDDFQRVMELILESTASSTERHEQLLNSIEINLKKAQLEQASRLITQVSSEVDVLRRRVEQTLQAQTNACAQATATATEIQLAYQKQIADTTMREKYQSFQNDVYTQLKRWMADWKAAVPLPPTVPTAKQNEQQLWYGAITKCFYTAIIARPGQAYDTLGLITPVPGWDYICFTNLDLPETFGWRIVKVEYTGDEPAVEAKRIKWLSHQMLPDYDVVIWMDAYLTPNPSYNLILYNWIQHMNKHNLSILHRPHNERICIWEECEAVLKSRRDTPEHVRAVEKLLREARMPKDWGLFDTNIIVKFNKDTRAQEISEAIFKQCETVSPRDQLAVSYIYFLKDYKGYKAQNLMNAFQAAGEHVRIPAI
jgi:hypothetical protein